MPGPGPASSGKQHHISTWPVCLGWAGPGSQRNEPPFCWTPEGTPHPRLLSMALPTPTGSFLGQTTLPGTLEGEVGIPGKGMSGAGWACGGGPVGVCMPDPAPGLVAQAFSQLSISLPWLFTPLTALGGFQSHSNLGTMLGPFQPQHGPEGSIILPAIPRRNAKHRSPGAQAGGWEQVPISPRQPEHQGLPKATVQHTVHHKLGSEAFFFQNHQAIHSIPP